MAMAERRAYERVADGPVMKGGAIRFAERHGTIPCVIRDISPAGARVRVIAAAGQERLLAALGADVEVAQ